MLAICSILNVPKISLSETALTTAFATSSTLTGGARSKSDAGKFLSGRVNADVAARSFFRGSPTNPNGMSTPFTFLFPYIKPGRRTVPGNLSQNSRDLKSPADYCSAYIEPLICEYSNSFRSHCH